MGIKFDDYFDDTPERPAEQPAAAGDDRREERPSPPRREYDEDYIEPGGRRRRRRYFKFGLIAAAVAVLAVAVHVVFFSKSVSGGMVRGYVVAIEKDEGVIFDSYECTLVVDYPDCVADTAALVFRFSTTDQEVGRRLYNAMKGDSLVVVGYDRYTAKMPWRGATEVVSDSIELVKAAPVLRSPAKVAADRKRFR